MKWLRLWAIAIIIGVAAPAAAQTPTPDYRQMVPVGTLMIWAGNSTPDGWLVANGSCVSQADYPQLYSAIGMVFDYTYSCPVGTFALPDLRDRFPRGAGPRTTSGQVGGAVDTTLVLGNLPAHTHTITTYVMGAAFVGSGGVTRYVATSAGSAGTTGSTGSATSFSVLNPMQVFVFIINAGTSALVLPPTVTPQPTSTPAPTATPQPTATPMEAAMGTPAPEVVVYSTITANGTDQNVAFAYSITAGDMLVSIMLFVTCGVMVMGMMLRARGGKS
jgi:microcystin-dependent protein